MTDSRACIFMVAPSLLCEPIVWRYCSQPCLVCQAKRPSQRLGGRNKDGRDSSESERLAAGSFLRALSSPLFLSAPLSKAGFAFPAQLPDEVFPGLLCLRLERLERARERASNLPVAAERSSFSTGTVVLSQPITTRNCASFMNVSEASWCPNIRTTTQTRF